MSARRVTVVVYPDFQALDVVGPVEVLSTANWLAGGGSTRYTIDVAATRAGLVRSDSGLTIDATRRLTSRTLRPDLLIIAGGVGARAAAGDEELVAAVTSLARSADQVAAICTGAFVLAETGLLAGEAATTHWNAADVFRARFPDIRLEPDRIFVNAGKLWTSAGVTAGIDLALELVRLDHGEALAAEIARNLVVYLQRSGGQAQYSAHLAAQRARHPTIRDIQTSISDAPEADHSMAALARRAMMSERTFQRTFKHETGVSPGRYVERVRIDCARRLLESTDDGVASVARACGFKTTETFLRAFQRQIGTSPTHYRGRFSR